LGNELTEHPGGCLIRNRTTPEVWDSNCVTRVRASSPTQIDQLMAAVEEHYSEFSHRCFKLDPPAPSAVEARLLLEGYQPDALIHLVLPPGRSIRPVQERDSPTIRRVESDQDWTALAVLARLDHEESAARAGRAVWSPLVTEQMVDRKRQRVRDLPYFLAWAYEEPVAYGCAWAGPHGVGMVEDLFTAPSWRHRGLATAIIEHAIERVRARGCDAVMIGAAADDSPRHMYAALGFIPLFVTRGYVLTPDRMTP
jgi:GNAT superfamily N-acetyltransferase